MIINHNSSDSQRQAFLNITSIKLFGKMFVRRRTLDITMTYQLSFIITSIRKLQ